MIRKIYRARYTERNGKGAWVTTVFRRTRVEAESDIAAFARHKNYGFDGVKIVVMDYEAYLKKYQRLPRF